MGVGALSTIAGSFIMHSLVVQTVKNLLDGALLQMSTSTVPSWRTSKRLMNITKV